jgi:flagellar hook assembly protein FlgD
VTDTLPNLNQMTYVAGSASNGGVYNAGQITWAIPFLAPGATLQLTYKAQVGLQVNNGDVLVNKACLSYAGGTNCVSESVTVQGAYVVKISIFTQSGELVKVLDTFDTSSAISSFNVVGDVIEAGQPTAQIYVGGLLLATWDATNAAGNTVGNGTYFVKVDSTDPFGITTTVTDPISVSLNNDQMQLKIFNSAGEAVLSLDQSQIAALLGGPLQTSDYSLGNTSFSPLVIAPSYADPTARGAAVVITMGSGRSFLWSGRNDSGGMVSPGQYIMEFSDQLSGQAQQTISQLITVESPSDSAVSGVVLAPNPIYTNQTQQAKFMITVNDVQADNVKINLYTIAGELMGHPITAPLSPGNNVVYWNIGNETIASGMYFAEIELKQGNNMLERKVIKVTVIH